MDGKLLICLEEGFILFVLLKGSAPSLAQKWEEEKNTCNVLIQKI